MTSQRWFIATNTDNLKFFYDCGMIVDKQAFPNSSYMHDIQAERPTGFLPCFSMNNLSTALKSARREDENLIACLVEIEFSNIRLEQVYAQNRKRKTGEFDSAEGAALALLEEAVEVLLPSPLPLSCIKNIFLSDAKVKKAVAQEFGLAFGEFPTKFFNTNAKLFKDQKPQGEDLELETEQNNPPIVQLEEIPEREINYAKAFAYGGALNLSFYQTKNGRLSSDLFEAFACNKLDTDECSHLLPLVSWVLNKENENELALFYSSIFDLVAAEDDLDTVRYDILKLFENGEGFPQGFEKPFKRLAVTLKEIVDRTNADDLHVHLSNLIEGSKLKEKWSSKIYFLISMIFVRDHSETLLKFYHEKFTEEDYFLLAVFFGLIKGIGTTPLDIRKIEGLRDWVSFKMVKLIHDDYPSSIFFEKGPSSPVLIHKKYVKRTSVPMRQDALQKFCSFIEVDESEVIGWTLTPKDEYKVKSGAITFSKRPSLYANVDHERLENLMIIKSIKETDKIFDFNKSFDIFKG